MLLIIFKLEKSNESEPQIEQENQRNDQIVQAVQSEKLERGPCSLQTGRKRDKINSKPKGDQNAKMKKQLDVPVPVMLVLLEFQVVVAQRYRYLIRFVWILFNLINISCQTDLFTVSGKIVVIFAARNGSELDEVIELLVLRVGEREGYFN